jgi:hypothetical protein
MLGIAALQETLTRLKRRLSLTVTHRKSTRSDNQNVAVAIAIAVVTHV